jgi:hypothetical protein
MNDIFFAAFHDELEKIAAINLKNLVGPGKRFTTAFASKRAPRPGGGYTMTALGVTKDEAPNRLMMTAVGPDGNLIKNTFRPVSGVKLPDSHKTLDSLNNLAEKPYAGNFYGFPGT